ncbi:MAG: 23S rRNA (guanosine(2251)-2'-O)-methyltransferase RlmB [Gammaproteobacteria bacterium]|nr:23S rRNA (guanosine(2251)-2'-O)-methyltransferase RlmB [Gammaproteobacteria bacterium]
MSKARFVTGLRAVEQLLAAPGSEVRKLYTEYRSANPRVAALIELAQAKGVVMQAANRARLQQISGESRHQGIVAEVQRSTVMDEAALRTLVEDRLVNEVHGPLLLLVLDGIQDPHNLGACLRTADAAGVDAVVVPRHDAAGLGPTVSKVAAGAAELVPFATVGNIGRVLAWLADYGVVLVGTSDTGSKSVFEAELDGPVALVMGREHSGLKKKVMERCDLLVHLPMLGSVESLNVSVATGVCLYEALRQRGAADAPTGEGPE